MSNEPETTETGAGAMLAATGKKSREPGSDQVPIRLPSGEPADKPRSDQVPIRLPSGEPADKPRSDQVPIRLPSGEQAWVSAGAFNLISEKQFRDSERLRRLRDQRNLAAAVAAVVLVIFIAGAIALLTRPAASGAGGAVGARAALREPGESPAPDILEIEGTVRAWARAWSARDAEAVLGFYSPSFLVPDGMRRATWEQLRRERIESPELLAVRVKDLTAERTGPESAVARFLQVYDTPGYRAWVMKTLELASESGRWLIVDELASLAELGTGAFEGEPELNQPAP